MKKRYLLLFVIAFLSIVAWSPFSFFTSSSTSADNDPNSKVWVEKTSKAILAQADNLDPDVLKLGLTAYLKARQEGRDQKQVLTILDYSKPSTERRLWVMDLKRDKVLFNTWVTHGKNSGEVKPTSFSNEPTSLKSSIGVFVTRETYFGHDGYSLRIDGLEPGINDNALRRNIVFHGAWYASGNVAKERGMLGRSWGCMAVGPNLIKPIANTIKNDTVVMAYYPDRHWLNNSEYVS